MSIFLLYEYVRLATDYLLNNTSIAPAILIPTVKLYPFDFIEINVIHLFNLVTPLGNMPNEEIVKQSHS
jgi:hypothetical protein